MWPTSHIMELKSFQLPIAFSFRTKDTLFVKLVQPHTWYPACRPAAWREGWDSNSRNPWRFGSLANFCTRPLCDLRIKRKQIHRTILTTDGGAAPQIFSPQLFPLKRLFGLILLGYRNHVDLACFLKKLTSSALAYGRRVANSPPNGIRFTALIFLNTESPNFPALYTALVEHLLILFSFLYFFYIYYTENFIKNQIMWEEIRDLNSNLQCHKLPCCRYTNNLIW